MGRAPHEPHPSDRSDSSGLIDYDYEPEQEQEDGWESPPRDLALTPQAMVL